MNREVPRLPPAVLSPAECCSRRESAGEQINKPGAAGSPSQPLPFLLSHAGLQQLRDGDAARREQPERCDSQGLRAGLVPVLRELCWMVQQFKQSLNVKLINGVGLILN